ncbi:hypothetical protein LTR62_007112 [Meristemomyces frigidus]|uniref:Calcineurin-like phosphoesterase domain-containing protein n=1 Tax=Meristemomyces frigidus TaxID=1508187 RepID=A0AAN7TBW4_9PEZI|nr:hypothetical protein LTR62_007112 [Meristemomyces frigidus]
MSDLHLERINYDYIIPKAAPILILAGDIGRFCDSERYRGFLSAQCDIVDLVLLVAGNHEFYGTSRSDGLHAAGRPVEEPSMHGRLRFLNRNRIDLPDSRVTVLGCTLQSNISDEYTKLTNDFARITTWSVKAHNEEHRRDVQWLKDSLSQLRQAEPDRKVVVVTHFAPMFKRVCHPLEENNVISQCFCSHALDQLRRSGDMKLVSCWVFGHTHWNAKFKVGHSAVMSNQLCNAKKTLSWWQRRTLFRSFNPQALIRVYSPQHFVNCTELRKRFTKPF